MVHCDQTVGIARVPYDKNDDIFGSRAVQGFALLYKNLSILC